VATSVWRVCDELWEAVEPLLAEHRADPRGGCPRVDDRVCFNAIVFLLFTGIAWRHLPREMGCSPATAHRRLAEWQSAGVWERLHRELLRALKAQRAIDWSVSVVDGSHIRALLGAPHRTLAGRPCSRRLKASPDHRCGWDSACDQPDRRAAQRRDAAAAFDRRRRADCRRAREAPQAHRAPARRSWL
jgi:transposase